MSETGKRDTAEKRYLLGVLSEDDKIRLEEDYFADDSKFEAVELAEDELIEAYLRKELSPAELQLFEAKLLGSERLRERVHFASALREKATSFMEFDTDRAIEPVVSRGSGQPRSSVRWWGGFFAERPALGIALAACVVLVFVAGIVLISRLRSESARLEAERAAAQRQKEDSDKLARDQEARAAQLDAQKQARDRQAAAPKLPEDSPQTVKLEKPGASGTPTQHVRNCILAAGFLAEWRRQSAIVNHWARDNHRTNPPRS